MIIIQEKLIEFVVEGVVRHIQIIRKNNDVKNKK